MFVEIKGRPFMLWLVLLGVSWLTAFAIQSIGESPWLKSVWKCVEKCKCAEIFNLQLIRYRPKSLYENDEEWYKYLIKFREKSKKLSDNHAQTLERFAIIKEVCGNAYVALFLSWAVIFLNEWIKLGVPNLSAKFWLASLLLGILVLYLRQMHVIHVHREYNYLKSVLDTESNPDPQQS